MNMTIVRFAVAKEDVKAAVIKTIQSIKANPKAANVFLKANTELVDGGQCSAQARDFPEMITELPELGGKMPA